jgi:hypothetical protein
MLCLVKTMTTIDTPQVRAGLDAIEARMLAYNITTEAERIKDESYNMIRQILVNIQPSVSEDSLSQIAHVLGEISSLYIDAARQSLTDTASQNVTGRIGPIPGSKFVVSWEQALRLDPATETFWRHSNRDNLKLAAAVESGASRVSLDQASKALLASASAGIAPAGFTAAIYATTTLHHRSGALASAPSPLHRVCVFAFLLMEFKWDTVVFLSSGKISAPWLWGVFFPVLLEGLPIIMVPKKAFYGIQNLDQAAFVQDTKNRTATHIVRAYLMAIRTPNASAHIFPLAHVTGFGPTDRKRECDSNVLDQGGVRAPHAWGYVTVIASYNRPMAKFASITGQHRSPGSDESFDENTQLHYDLAPWVVGKYKFCHEILTPPGQWGYFNMEGSEATVLTGSIPMSYDYTLASNKEGTEESMYTYGSVPRITGALHKNYLTSRIPSAAPIFRRN